MGNLTVPINSFIQQNSAPVLNCAEQVTMCLPVYAVTDIAFQIKYDSADYPLYKAQLIKDGSVVGGAVTLIGVTTGTITALYCPSIAGMGFESLSFGDCFSIRIIGLRKDGTTVVVFQSICLQKIDDPCFTSVLKYQCDENSFGFDYTTLFPVHPFPSFPETAWNIIRLPFYLTEPQYPVKRNVFIKSDGSRKKLSSRIEKTYQGLGGYMPKEWHEKLIVALENDYVLIENVNAGTDITTAFSNENDYKVDWIRFLNYPTAPSEFQLFQTPFNNVNSNCNG